MIDPSSIKMPVTSIVETLRNAKIARETLNHTQGLPYFMPDMRKIICTLVFILTLTLTAGGSSMNDKDIITNLYHEMYSAMIRKDSHFLAEILDDGFALVHMTGMRQPKNEYIAAISEGVLNYYTEETENVIISVNENTAKLTGQSRVSAAVFGGGIHTWRLQLDISLVKKADKWLMTHAEASTY